MESVEFSKEYTLHKLSNIFFYFQMNCFVIIVGYTNEADKFAASWRNLFRIITDALWTKFVAVLLSIKPITKITQHTWQFGTLCVI